MIHYITNQIVYLASQTQSTAAAPLSTSTSTTAAGIAIATLTNPANQTAASSSVQQVESCKEGQSKTANAQSKQITELTASSSSFGSPDLTITREKFELFSFNDEDYILADDDHSEEAEILRKVSRFAEQLKNELDPQVICLKFIEELSTYSSFDLMIIFSKCDLSPLEDTLSENLSSAQIHILKRLHTPKALSKIRTIAAKLSATCNAFKNIYGPEKCKINNRFPPQEKPCNLLGKTYPHMAYLNFDEVSNSILSVLRDVIDQLIHLPSEGIKPFHDKYGLLSIA